MGGICCCHYKEKDTLDAGIIVRKQVVRPSPLPLAATFESPVVDNSECESLFSPREFPVEREATPLHAIVFPQMSQAISTTVSSPPIPVYKSIPLYFERIESYESVMPPPEFSSEAEAYRPISPGQCHLGNMPCQWAEDANRWRFLLRTSQSLVATCLYGMSTFIRGPSRPMLVQFLIAAILAPLFAFVYHELSLNRAGSYYDTFLQMFLQLPRLLSVIVRRNADEYRNSVQRERLDGVVRTVNGLESGLLFLLLSHLTLIVALLSVGELILDLRWKCCETALFFILHRLWGANVFKGRFLGLLQPESMWQFERDLDGTKCRMRPLGAAPVAPY